MYSGPLLQVHGGGRYLVDARASSAPHRIKGVANWLIHLQVAPASGSSFPNSAGSTLAAGQDAWFTAMAALGCNSVVIQLISKYQSTAPNDSDGNSPFTGAMFSTPRQAYFDSVKLLVQKAALAGFTVGIAPCWAGYDSGQGFYTDIEAATGAVMEDYGEYVAQQFEPYDNVWYILGGDRPSPSATLDSRFESVATGIRAFDSRHFLTVHWNFAAGDNPTVTGATDVTSCYKWSDGTVPAQVRAEYAENDAPVMMLEALYELNTGFGATAFVLREQTIGSLLNGALAGTWFGHEGTWHAGGGNPGSQPNLPSQSTGKAYDLNSTGINQQKAIHDVFDAREWWKLAPDTGSALVTAGRGTIDTVNYAVAALASDSSFAIVYCPTGGSLTIALSQFSGPVRARWYDPTNGATEEAGAFSNSGSQAFSHATNNAGGDDDWLLVFDLQGAVAASSAPSFSAAAVGAVLYVAAASSAPTLTGGATGASLAASAASSAPTMNAAALGQYNDIQAGGAKWHPDYYQRGWIPDYFSGA